MSKTILSSLFAQKSWSNTQLFDVLAEADPSKHPVELQAAIRTLNHIYVVDSIFRSHLTGSKHDHKATNTEETPDLGNLQFNVAETDLWFEKYLSDADLETLAENLSFTFTDGDAGRMSREEMLFHVALHGAYHRGNVGQILKNISVTPPRDLYTKFLHVTEPSRRRA